MRNIRRQQKKERQIAKRKADMAGVGSFLFINNTSGEFYLPRPTKEGKRVVKKGEQFVGDSYYFGLLKTGEIRLIKEVSDEKSTDLLFVYQNMTRSDLRLPHPTKNGQSVVQAFGEFIGDSSYFELLRNGSLKLIKEVDISMSDKQLLTEQPPTVTHDGQVEYVVSDDNLTEEKKKNQEKLVERGTIDGVMLLLD